MTIKFTIFKSIYDNRTHNQVEVENFGIFEKSLYTLASVPREGKFTVDLISPATYKEDTTRCNDGVTSWGGWCAVDVDDFSAEHNLQNQLHKKFGKWYYVCYSTASSTKEKPKFRLVFPLTESVEARRIKHFWYALQTMMGNLGDAQTKDLSRMYYLPGKYEGAYNFIFTNKGDIINPIELMGTYNYWPPKKSATNFFDRLPGEMQAQIIEHRKSNMKISKDISWNTYRDCPFFPKKLGVEYRAITNTGWYSKMYSIMVSIAGNAIKNNYPITPEEISEMCIQLDKDTGNWYKNRPMIREADRALEYVWKNS
jgi:hypothetical protein